MRLKPLSPEDELELMRLMGEDSGVSQEIDLGTLQMEGEVPLPPTIENTSTEAPDAGEFIMQTTIPNEITQETNDVGLTIAALEGINSFSGGNIIRRGIENVGTFINNAEADLPWVDKPKRPYVSLFEGYLDYNNLSDEEKIAYRFGEPVGGALGFAGSSAVLGANTLKQAGTAGLPAALKARDALKANSNVMQRIWAKVFPEGKTAAAINPSSAYTGGFTPTFIIEGTERAAKSPVSFWAGEGVSALGAGSLGAAAQNYFPENDGAQIIAESLGGTVNMLGMLKSPAESAGGWAKGQFDKLANSSKAPVANQKAVNALGDVIVAFDSTGRTPEEVIAEVATTIETANARIKEAGFSGNVPGAYISNNEALITLQNQLVASEGTENVSRLNHLTADFHEAYRDLIGGFSLVGSPDSLAAAANLRRSYFNSMLDNRVNRAEADALSARTALLPNESDLSPEALTRAQLDASNNIAQISRQLRADLKQVEAASWAEVDMGAWIGDSPTVQPLLDDLSDALADYGRNAPEAARAVEGKSLETIINGEAELELVRRVRTQLLGLNTRDNPELARYVGQVAPKLREILIDVGGPPIKSALEDSARIRQAIDNTFVSDIISDRPQDSGFISDSNSMRVATGNRRASTPEEGIETLLGVGQVADEMSPTELNSGFGWEHSIRNEVEGYLAALSSRFRTSSGDLDYNKMSKYVADNPTVFDNFPELKAKLSNAASAAEHFDLIKQSNQAHTKEFLNETTFQKLFGDDKNSIPPETTIRELLGSNTPDSAYRQMVITATRAEESGDVVGAVDSVGAATIGYAVSQAQKGASNNMPKFWTQLNSIMFEAGTRNRSNKSLADLMIQNGTASQEEVDTLKGIIELGRRVGQAQTQRARLDEDFYKDLPEYVREVVVKFAGFRAGSALASQAGMQSNLQIVSLAGNFFQKIFSTSPQEKHRLLLLRIMEDPETLADALRRYQSGGVETMLDDKLSGAYSAYLQSAAARSGVEIASGEATSYPERQAPVYAEDLLNQASDEDLDALIRLLEESEGDNL